MAIHDKFDPTGKEINNLVTNEHHSITNSSGSVIVSNSGLFYSESLKVKDLSTNTFLKLNVDFTFIGFDAELTALTGLETVSAIQLLDCTFRSTLQLEYQAVGGKEGGITALLLDLRNRVIAFAECTNWGDLQQRLETLLYVVKQNYITFLELLSSKENIINKSAKYTDINSEIKYPSWKGISSWVKDNFVRKQDLIQEMYVTNGINRNIPYYDPKKSKVPDFVYDKKGNLVMTKRKLFKEINR